MKRFIFALLLGLFTMVGFSKPLQPTKVKQDLEKTFLQSVEKTSTATVVLVVFENGKPNYLDRDKSLPKNSFIITTIDAQPKFNFLPQLAVNSWRIQNKDFNIYLKENPSVSDIYKESNVCWCKNSQLNFSCNLERHYLNKFSL